MCHVCRRPHSKRTKSQINTFYRETHIAFSMTVSLDNNMSREWCVFFIFNSMRIEIGESAMLPELPELNAKKKERDWWQIIRHNSASECVWSTTNRIWKYFLQTKEGFRFDRIHYYYYSPVSVRVYVCIRNFYILQSNIHVHIMHWLLHCKNGFSTFPV